MKGKNLPSQKEFLILQDLSYCHWAPLMRISKNSQIRKTRCRDLLNGLKKQGLVIEDEAIVDGERTWRLTPKGSDMVRLIEPWYQKGSIRRFFSTPPSP